MIRILYRAPDGTNMIILPEDRLASGLSDERSLVWVDIEGQGTDYGSWFVEKLGLEPEVVADALEKEHFPKFENRGEYLYLIMQAVDLIESEPYLDLHEIDLFLGSNFLISHHNEAVKAIEHRFRECQTDGCDSLRGPDNLLYELADTITSDFKPCLAMLEEEDARVEDEVLKNPTSDLVNHITMLRRASIYLHRILLEQREVLNRLANDNYRQIDKQSRGDFRRLHEQMKRLVTLSDSLRDMIAGTFSAYLALTSHRMNQLVTLLTVIIAVALPLTVLTGFFGMNFFGPTYEVRAPLSGIYIFVFLLTFMVLAPIVMWRLINGLLKR
jgi:magnesium transporter